MRFGELPREFQMVAVNFLREIKNQSQHAYCFAKRSQRRRGAYSSWEQHRNCDAEIWAQDGHCKHGVYVGGCGADYMCGMCESGVTDYEWAMGRAFHAYRAAQKEKARIEVEAIFEFFKKVDYDTNVPLHKEMIQRASALNIEYKVN